MSKFFFSFSLFLWFFLLKNYKLFFSEALPYAPNCYYKDNKLLKCLRLSYKSVLYLLIIFAEQKYPITNDRAQRVRTKLLNFRAG